MHVQEVLESQYLVTLYVECNRALTFEEGEIVLAGLGLGAFTRHDFLESSLYSGFPL
jgi:hypothetical protein